MNSCVFPGSFDPVTKGHLDLIERISRIFDRVTVTVMINPQKKASISPDNRVMLLRKCCSPLPNVIIDSWDGLLADYLRLRNETVVVRGIRNSLEYESEMAAHQANHLLYDRLETLFLPSSPQYSGVSSSAVKEILSFGGNISAFVPQAVTEEIQQLLSNIK